MSEKVTIVYSVTLFLIMAGAVFWALRRTRSAKEREAELVQNLHKEGQAKRDAQRNKAVAENTAEAFRSNLERVMVGYEPYRYQIKIADWGPDFTGENGTLPRFRWAVVDADHALRRALGINSDSEPEVFMVGNSPTAKDAYLAAAEWIEKTNTTEYIVEGNFQ